jgi:hypothetical protein
MSQTSFFYDRLILFLRLKKDSQIILKNSDDIQIFKLEA